MNHKQSMRENSSVFHALRKREYSSHVRDSWKVLQNFQSSRYYIEKLSLLKKLTGHYGCVNSVLFSDSGEYIFTGSDDTRIKIYRSIDGEIIDTITTQHTNNIFYAKELPNPNHTIENIISCAADGRIILMHLESRQSRQLFRHTGRAHRIAIMPNQYNTFLSCGEDGICCLFDLREKTHELLHDSNLSAEILQTLQSNQYPSLKFPFRGSSAYCIGVNPSNANEIALAGTNPKVLLYDIRMPREPTKEHCPQHLETKSDHVTGLKYNHNGSLLLATYNDEKIYSFLIANPREQQQSQDVAMKHEKKESSRSWTEAFRLNFISSSSSSSTKQSSNHETEDTSGSPYQSSIYSPVSKERRKSLSVETITQLENNLHKGYYQCYQGHRNSDTVKQVSFFGSNSEYVVSGSDCGHIFIWDTFTSEIVKILHGDEDGAINCLSSHPHLPMLATSGLENTAKLWMPIGEHEPLVEGSRAHNEAQRLLVRNSDRSTNSTTSIRALRMLLRMLASRGGGAQVRFTGADGEEEGGEGGADNDADADGGEEGPQRRRRRFLNWRELFSLEALLAGEEDEEDEEQDEEVEEESAVVHDSSEEDQEEDEEEGEDGDESDRYEDGDNDDDRDRDLQHLVVEGWADDEEVREVEEESSMEGAAIMDDATTTTVLQEE